MNTRDKVNQLIGYYQGKLEEERSLLSEKSQECKARKNHGERASCDLALREFGEVDNSVNTMVSFLDQLEGYLAGDSDTANEEIEESNKSGNEVRPPSSREIIREFNDIFLAGHGDLPVLCNGKSVAMVDTSLSNTINISYLSPLSPKRKLDFKSVYSDVVSNFDGHLIRGNGGDIYHITVKNGSVGIHSA